MRSSDLKAIATGSMTSGSDAMRSILKPGATVKVLRASWGESARPLAIFWSWAAAWAKRHGRMRSRRIRFIDRSPGPRSDPSNTRRAPRTSQKVVRPLSGSREALRGESALRRVRGAVPLPGPPLRDLLVQALLFPVTPNSSRERTNMRSVVLVPVLLVALPSFGQQEDEMKPGLIAEFFNIGKPMEEFPTIAAERKPDLRRVDRQINYE